MKYDSLLIDLNFDKIIFILLDKQSKNYVWLIEESHNKVIDIVNSSLETFLINNKTDIKEIKNIYFNYGPGNYTGNKGTINVIKTIYVVFKDKKFFGFNGLELLSNKNGIGLVDAKGQKSFIGVYKNNKVLLEPQLVLNSELKHIYDKYHDLKVFDESKVNDIYINHFFNLVDDIKEIKDPIDIEPLYLKSPV